jgi:hypothetical protein
MDPTYGNHGTQLTHRGPFIIGNHKKPRDLPLNPVKPQPHLHYGLMGESVAFLLMPHSSQPFISRPQRPYLQR